MNSKAVDQFMAYMESIRTTQNSAIIDSICEGLAVTEGIKWDKFKKGARELGQMAMPLATAATVAGVGAVGGNMLLNGSHSYRYDNDNLHKHMDMAAQIADANDLEKRPLKSDKPLKYNGRTLDKYKVNPDETFVYAKGNCELNPYTLKASKFNNRTGEMDPVEMGECFTWVR